MALFTFLCMIDPLFKKNIITTKFYKAKSFPIF